MANNPTPDYIDVEPYTEPLYMQIEPATTSIMNQIELISDNDWKSFISSVVSIGSPYKTWCSRKNRTDANINICKRRLYLFKQFLERLSISTNPDDIKFIYFVIKPNIQILLNSLGPVNVQNKTNTEVARITELINSINRKSIEYTIPHDQIKQRLPSAQSLVRRNSLAGGDRYYKKYLKYKQKYLQLKNMS